MNCPICKTTNLVMTSRENIEIDYCPDCRGVWLDRGELDKIIEKSSVQVQTSQLNYSDQPQNYHQTPSYQNNNPKQSSKHGDEHGNYNNCNNGYYKKKKENWLGELFDF